MILPRIDLDSFNDVENAPAANGRHSWIPQSLIAMAQNPPEPPTIGGVLYPGKRTLLSGETESMKTWLALILAKAELDLEIPVAWVDLDDMGPGALLQRLRLLGVDDDKTNEQFLYYQPEQRLKDTPLDEVIRGIAVTGVRLMVIDAFTPMLHLHGLDPNNSIDIEAFWREIADPIAKAGAAPLMLDHVVKNADGRGKYATGSERKASGATVHLGASSITQLSIGGTGRALLTVHKDRPGYLPRPNLGALELTSTGDEITYELKPDKSHTADGFRPTILMERISRAVEQMDEPVTTNWVKETVKGNIEAKLQALEVLVADGYLQREKGPRGAHLHTLKNRYREDEDVTTSDEETTGSSTGSPPVPLGGSFGVSSRLVPPPLLLRRGNRSGSPEQVVPETLGTGENGSNGTIPWELLGETPYDPDDEPL